VMGRTGSVNVDVVANPLLAAVLAGSFFLAVFLVSRGRWMGFGDVKFSVAMGLILGFPQILTGLFFAFFIGAIIGTGLIFFNLKKISSEIPFGPFLATGTAIALFFGPAFVNWYLSATF